jgi:hypothetical protein
MNALFEYELYFPVGKDINRQAHLEALKHRLTEFFGGLTDFRHRSDGEWKIGSVIYHDEIVLLRMLGNDREQSRGFLRAVASDLATTLGEQEILIIEREVQSI